MLAFVVLKHKLKKTYNQKIQLKKTLYIYIYMGGSSFPKKNGKLRNIKAVLHLNALVHRSKLSCFFYFYARVRE